MAYIFNLTNIFLIIKLKITSMLKFLPARLLCIFSRIPQIIMVILTVHDIISLMHVFDLNFT